MTHRLSINGPRIHHQLNPYTALEQIRSRARKFLNTRFQIGFSATTRFAGPRNPVLVPRLFDTALRGAYQCVLAW